jgi:putative oxidoreductase
MANLDPRFRSFTQAALRIVAGLAFFTHGAQKLFGWFVTDPSRAPVELMSQAGLAGVIETVAGICIAVGFLTRPMAFIASGEMAVAYIWAHWIGSGKMWWWENRGELALVYAFIWLLFAAWGAGPASIDSVIARRRSGLDLGTPPA